MRSLITRMAPLLAILAGASAGFAATVTPAATAPTAENSPAGPSPATSTPSSPTFVPSPPPTTPPRTPLPSVSPAPAATVVATPTTIPDVSEEEIPGSQVPSAEALPTSPPVGAVRAFRTPERAAEPAFVAPQAEVPTDPGDTQAEDLENESMAPPDEPYVATVTFHALASTEVDGFDLFVIYPRSAGDFVGSRNGVDCRDTGNATLFADDHEDGTLRILVAGSGALTFPLDVVCRFTVAPNASLTSRLIAVNVAEVTAGGANADPSVLTVSVTAR